MVVQLPDIISRKLLPTIRANVINCNSESNVSHSPPRFSKITMYFTDMPVAISVNST